MKRYAVYTDGSASPRPEITKTGWAAIITDLDSDNKSFRCVGGFSSNSTIVEAEIMGIISALENIEEPGQILLFSDSMSTLRGITDKKARQGPWTLWDRLDTLAKPHQLNLRWVKAHAGRPFNELADEIAKFHFREQKLHEKVQNDNNNN